jgi:hypothetical protein
MYAMQREIKYDSLETFLSDLRDLSINRIAFCETCENRSEQIEPHVLKVVYLDRVELIAYRDSVIYKCEMRNFARESLYDKLVCLGFDVSRRSRNIT